MEAKRKHDVQRRAEDEHKVTLLLERAQVLRGQLYQARWDVNLTKDQRKRAVLAMKRELLACERAAAAARTAADEALDRMLGLDQLGIGPAELFGEAGDSAAGHRTPLEEETEAIARARQHAEQTELNNLKMMRVQSREVTKDLSAADKWAHLYGMYDSSRSPVPVHQEYHKPSIFKVRSSASEDEVTRLRGQLYQLKQKTNMSQADRIALADLQARLKAATGGGA
jgi:hypothetical protein